MKAQIYINRHVVVANKKASELTGELVDNAAISVNTHLGVVYAKHIEFTAPCSFVQDAKNARCSGATVWIEATFESLVIDGVEADRAMFSKDYKYSQGKTPVSCNEAHNAQVFVSGQIIGANKKATKELGETVDNPAITVKFFSELTFAKRVDFSNGCVLIRDANRPRCVESSIWIEAATNGLFVSGETLNSTKFQQFQEAV